MKDTWWANAKVTQLAAHKFNVWDVENSVFKTRNNTGIVKTAIIQFVCNVSNHLNFQSKLISQGKFLSIKMAQLL